MKDTLLATVHNQRAVTDYSSYMSVRLNGAAKGRMSVVLLIVSVAKILSKMSHSNQALNNEHIITRQRQIPKKILTLYARRKCVNSFL